MNVWQCADCERTIAFVGSPSGMRAVGWLYVPGLHDWDGTAAVFCPECRQDALPREIGFPCATHGLLVCQACWTRVDATRCQMLLERHWGCPLAPGTEYGPIEGL